MELKLILEKGHISNEMGGEVSFQPQPPVLHGNVKRTKF